jgi:hypothetical protein
MPNIMIEPRHILGFSDAMKFLKKHHPRWALAVTLKLKGHNFTEMAKAMNVCRGRAIRVYNRSEEELKIYMGILPFRGEYKHYTKDGRCEIRREKKWQYMQRVKE